jgi:Protein of unknown function (DUF2605).
MFSSNPPDSDLLKSLLEPLLDDFHYWFERSRQLLETEEIPFLSAEEQADLLDRVVTAQKEVSTTQMLFKATNGQVGIEASMMAPWHRLVTECWKIAVRFRLERSA